MAPGDLGGTNTLGWQGQVQCWLMSRAHLMSPVPAPSGHGQDSHTSPGGFIFKAGCFGAHFLFFLSSLPRLVSLAGVTSSQTTSPLGSGAIWAHPYPLQRLGLWRTERLSHACDTKEPMSHHRAIASPRADASPIHSQVSLLFSHLEIPHTWNFLLQAS